MWPRPTIMQGQVAAATWVNTIGNAGSYNLPPQRQVGDLLIMMWPRSFNTASLTAMALNGWSYSHYDYNISSVSGRCGVAWKLLTETDVSSNSVAGQGLPVDSGAFWPGRALWRGATGITVHNWTPLLGSLVSGGTAGATTAFSPSPNQAYVLFAGFPVTSSATGSNAFISPAIPWGSDLAGSSVSDFSCNAQLWVNRTGNSAPFNSSGIIELYDGSPLSVTYGGRTVHCMLELTA